MNNNKSSKLPNKQVKASKKNTEKTEDFPIEVAEVINELPKDKQQTLIKAFAVRRHYSGPLPDGDTIQIYDAVIPNGGNRLMNNVETQLGHRIDIEKTGVRRSFNQSSTGQWMGFGIAILFGFIAWDLAKFGQSMVAAVLGGIDLVALVAIFITGKMSKK